MEEHRIKTTLEQDGTLTLEGLPFHAGETVEVIILAESQKAVREKPYPLRGTTVTYRDPFDSVAADDWEAVR